MTTGEDDFTELREDEADARERCRQREHHMRKHVIKWSVIDGMVRFTVVCCLIVAVLYIFFGSRH